MDARNKRNPRELEMKILIIRMKNSGEDIEDKGEAISQNTVQNYKTNLSPEYSKFS